MVVGMSAPQDVVFRSGDETERLYRQYVSGNLFGVFGLQPALGRLLTPNDDLTPGAHPVAVLSYDYWTRRFAQDSSVLGETLFVKNVPLTVIGIAAPGFRGIEPAISTDFWVPLQNRAELNAWGNSADINTL